MTQIREDFDEKLHSLLMLMAEAGIHNAARGISSMVGETLAVEDPKVTLVPLSFIQDLLGGPENEAVGIYLRAEGTLASQFMMIVPLPKALELVNLMMGEPVGTNQSLGSMERSALAELGNITGSFFLNAVAAKTGLEARPTPPAVIVDMVGAILDILLMTWDGLSENVLMIQTCFLSGAREVQADFWVLPDRSTLEAIGKNQARFA